jgi:hypothetical protein
MQAAMESYQIFRTAKRRAGQYCRDVEASEDRWKQAHDIAMACMDLQETLSHGIGLYEDFKRLDAAWRKGVASGQLPYDPKVHQALKDVFRWWLIPCRSIDRRILFFERKGLTVDNAETFRRYREEAEWMLTPAKDSLRHGAIRRLRDEAIEEHRAGRTTED